MLSPDTNNLRIRYDPASAAPAKYGSKDHYSEQAMSDT